MIPNYNGILHETYRENEMTKEELKNISVGVTNECWKKLKILSIQKEITLAECVKDILEKSVSRKNLLEETI